ncbi:hypothetical protein CPB97_005682 [Podila verticillata]|nr:hypothetical protein CPB97_005682 [Podila verticillata]
MLCASTTDPSPTYSPANIEYTMASTFLTSRSSSPVNLPEIISAIVSYLDQPNLARAARINQTWASICLPILYRDISLSSRTFNIKSLELGLKKHGHYSQKLFAARDVNHWCSRIRAALLNMPNLVQLDALWMNADLLESVIQLQHLERLSAPRMQGSHPDDHSYFLPSFTGSSKITHLDMSDSHLVHDKVLVQITRACPKIEVLALSGNSCLTHAGLIEWCNGNLHLSEPDSSSAQDPFLAQPNLSLFTTSLTSINFSNCNKIETEGFEALFQHSHQLQDLNLMSTKVGDTALEILADNNKHLRSLVLTCCAAISAQGLSRILRTSRALESVSFMYCSRVSAMVFFQLPLWTCTQLRELRFSLNKRHLDWVENGLSAAESASMVAMAQLLDSGNNNNNNNAAGDASTVTTTTQDTTGDIHMMDLLADEGSEFHEPLFQHFVEGFEIPVSPSDDENDNETCRKSTDSTRSPLLSSPVTSTPPTTIQQYRQHMILAQLYRQIERLTQLRVLDMRDLHLPLDLDSGLWRLGSLSQLEMLEWTGLQAPLREQEVAWLTSSSGGSSSEEEKPLPVLRQLLIKGGCGMSSVERAALQAGRPELDLQLIQVREM